jgi:hypothetical protein
LTEIYKLLKLFLIMIKKEKGWGRELTGLGSSERKSPMSPAAGGPAVSKFPGELLFQKILCYHAPHAKIGL